jgi:hypothetical protein
MSSREKSGYEQLRPTTPHPAGALESEDSIISPLYSWIILWVLAGVTLSLVATILFFRHGPQSPNPFSEYADIVPGQAHHTVIDRGFSCIPCTDPASNGCGYIRQEGFPNPYSGQYCTIDPVDGSFSHIKVIVSDNIIRRVRFVPHEDRLAMGELTLLMGERPEVTLDRQSVTLVRLEWAGAGVTAYGWTKRKTVDYDISVRSIELALPLDIRHLL